MRDQLPHLVPAATLALGCVLVWGMREQLRMQPRAEMSSIVVEAPGRKQTDIVIDTTERRIAGMDQYLHRVFRTDSLDPGFSVYVGYYTYQVQGKAIHSPKNCLPGAGWEPLQSAPRVVQVGDREVTVNRYLLANKGAQALVYYWYQGRGRIEHDEYKVKWNLLRDAALHGRTEEALVRIVIPLDVRGRSPEQSQLAYKAADAQADSLTRQLIPRVEQALPVEPGA